MSVLYKNYSYEIWMKFKLHLIEEVGLLYGTSFKPNIEAQRIGVELFELLRRGLGEYYCSMSEMNLAEINKLPCNPKIKPLFLKIYIPIIINLLPESK